MNFQPKALLQHYLEDVGEAVLTDRYDLYQPRVQLPFRLRTASSNLVVETAEALQDGFDDYVSMLQDLGVTSLLRTVIDASQLSHDSVTGTFWTEHLRGQTTVVPKFFSRIWLRLIDGVWMSPEIHNTTQNTRWPIIKHRVLSPSWPPKETLS